MNYFFIIMGFVFLILATIGIPLPLLPTTPFALLAAFCFSKGSPKIYSWCLSLPIIGEAITDWKQSGLVRVKAKVSCLIVVSASLVSIWMHENIQQMIQIAVTIFLFCLLCFVFSRPSKAKESTDERIST